MIACALSVAEEVATRFQVTWAEIVGSGRMPWVCKARVHVVGVLRDSLHLSFPEIAMVMRRLCHTSAFSMYHNRWVKMSKEERDAFIRSLETIAAYERGRHGTPDQDDGGSGAGIQPQESAGYARRKRSVFLGEASKEQIAAIAAGTVSRRNRKRPSVIWESMANHRA